MKNISVSGYKAGNKWWQQNIKTLKSQALYFIAKTNRWSSGPQEVTKPQDVCWFWNILKNQSEEHRGKAGKEAWADWGLLTAHLTSKPWAVGVSIALPIYHKCDKSWFLWRFPSYSLWARPVIRAFPSEGARVTHKNLRELRPRAATPPPLQTEAPEHSAETTRTTAAREGRVAARALLQPRRARPGAEASFTPPPPATGPSARRSLGGARSRRAEGMRAGRVAGRGGRFRQGRGTRGEAWQVG